MTKVDLILAYIYNKSEREDEAFRQLRRNLMHRNVDEEDCLELIIQKSRMDAINEILIEILRLAGY